MKEAETEPSRLKVAQAEQKKYEERTKLEKEETAVA